MDTRGLTRAAQAAATIRACIIDGEFLSGERLIELTLAQRLQVSQITIRDALRELEQQGWVVRRARRGVYVRGFDHASAADLFALYVAVGGLVLDGLAEASARRALLREARQHVEAARRLSASGARAAAIAALFDAHAALCEVSGRALSAQILGSLVNQARLLEAVRQARIPGTLGEMQLMLERHDALLAALEQGDAPAARAHLHEIIGGYSASVDAALHVP